MPVNILKFVYYAFDPRTCFENEIKYDGASIGGTMSPTVNAAECQEKCQSHAKCKVWTHYSISSHCHLKEVPGARQSAAASVTSGPKVCPWNVTALRTGNVHDILTRQWLTKNLI